tara:strand:- start:2020 stop:4077 length:2058 start_codon:yes stop_codon:yes gene_type:complete
MILKNIKLNNIRSYKNQEIRFPEGSTMLSGNIGSGKSTILLSIDFALFGITRDLPGSALLRNGEKEGSVELHCSVNEKDMIIKRNLKRTPTSVAQDSGYIITDDQKQELTARELKQKVLEIFNYPPELLTKSKSMIYHYTVYTPQEKMKEILLSSREHRLEILRKIFGIDKYKRIRDNVDLFITSIKQKSRELAASIADLEEKEEVLRDRERKCVGLKQEVKGLLPGISTLQSRVSEKKLEIEALEKKIKETEEIKSEIKTTKVSIEHKTEERIQVEDSSKNLVSEVHELKEFMKEFPLPNPSLADKILILEKEITGFENQNIHSQKKITGFETKKESHEKLSNEINSLSECPLCHQKVGEKHKHEVSTNEAKKIEKIDKELMALKRNFEEGTSILETKKKSLSETIQTLNKQEITLLKQKELKSKEEQLRKLQDRITKLNEDIESLTARKKELKFRIEQQKEIDTQTLEKKQGLEKLSENLRKLEIKKAASEAELNTILSIIDDMKEEIRTKHLAKKNISKIIQIREWLEKQFINITIVMEKRIMLRVHSELESLIQKWFSMLVNSETIKICIDEEFTPVIEQNGHATDYLHLSGGEKTSAALAYRLALNQVINTLLSKINTRNTLMLDEPTDGFSQDQLDRIRNILEELNTKQTIIVSHDPKIESFVDNVVRLQKSEHITHII